MPQHADKPNPQQQEWLDYIKSGLSPVQAATAAGYKDPKHSAIRLQKLDWAKKELANLAAVQAKEMQMSREKVQEGILDAIELARIGGKTGPDPSAMIRGWAEINRMCGFYAPEKKQLELTTAQKRLRTDFETLPDDKLLEMIEGEVIEGECERLDDD